MVKKIILTVLSFFAAGILIYFGFKWLLTTEQTQALISLPLSIHFNACALVAPVYIFSGLQTAVLLKMMYNRSISVFDIITLPFSVAFWGYVIPFQGAYIYNAAYLKSKYNISLANTTGITIMSYSVSLLIAGVLGLVYSFYSFQNIIFLVISVLFLIHPIFVIVLIRFMRLFMANKRNIFVTSLSLAEQIFQDYIGSFFTKNVMAFAVMSIADSILVALWTWWVSCQLDLGLSFFQLLILQFFLKAALIFKFTPGNIGVVQFASSGIILLVGGTVVDGFSLSIYQSAISAIVSVFFGSAFTLMNMKHFFKNHHL